MREEKKHNLALRPSSLLGPGTTGEGTVPIGFRRSLPSVIAVRRRGGAGGMAAGGAERYFTRWYKPGTAGPGGEGGGGAVLGGAVVGG